MFRVEVRPMTADERQRLEQWKQAESGRLLDEDTGNTVPYILSGAAALGLLGLQAGRLTPWLKLGAAAWAGMSAVGLGRLSAKHSRRRGEAATRWVPVLEKGQVEVLRVQARAVIELDDADGERGWFFDVGEGQVFVLWHDPYEGEPFPSTELRVTRVPGSAWVLDVACLGTTLTPVRPRRRLRRGEYVPAQCELLAAGLDTLEQDLVRLQRERPGTPSDAAAPTAEALSARLRVLVDGVEALGFYKYVTREDIAWVKDASRQGAGPWFQASLRGHAADAERLAEGGVGDLLGRVGEVLRAEGVVLGEVREHFEAKGAYSLRVGGREHPVYSAREASRAEVWQLAQQRALGLVNALLEEAGSAERAWLMSGGEDGVLVFLTPELRAFLARHWPFPREDLPEEVTPRRVRSPRP
jgi:hypothetical protein